MQKTNIQNAPKTTDIKTSEYFQLWVSLTTPDAKHFVRIALHRDQATYCVVPFWAHQNRNFTGLVADTSGTQMGHDAYSCIATFPLGEVYQFAQDRLLQAEEAKLFHPISHETCLFSLVTCDQVRNRWPGYESAIQLPYLHFVVDE